LPRTYSGGHLVYFTTCFIQPSHLHCVQNRRLRFRVVIWALSVPLASVRLEPPWTVRRPAR
jgi:hypothetical protein